MCESEVVQVLRNQKGFLILCIASEWITGGMLEETAELVVSKHFKHSDVKAWNLPICH